DELLSRGDLVPIRDLDRTQKAALSDDGDALSAALTVVGRLAAAPVGLALQAAAHALSLAGLGATAGAGRVDEPVVVMPLLKETEAALLAACQPAVAAHAPDDVLTADQVYEMVSTAARTQAQPSPLQLSQADVGLVLRQLAVERKAAVAIGDDGAIEAVRFCTRGSTARPAAITSVDRGLVRVRRTVAAVTAQLHALDARQDSLRSEAQQALRAGHRTRAAGLLRRRRAVSEQAEKRAAALATLEAILDGVRGAHTDAQ
ncbi:hypothetical protein HK405_001232, partial [Cladochytrium tenue]